ncbi:MAG: peptidylprolyl isomerase [Alphaproteobacteria bacterium]
MPTITGLPMSMALRLVSIALALALAFPLGAQDVGRIAAVVNDDVISLFDLGARTRLVVMSAGVQDTIENRRRLAPQVLRTLIDEKLQLQEAKRLNVAVSAEEIKEALGSIEKQSNIPPGSLDGYLARGSVPKAVLVQQVSATIAWSKILRREMRNTVVVGVQEVDDVVAQLESRRGQPESLVAEIYLAIDDPAQDEEIRAAAERLIEQIKSGVSFEGLARQFSQSATAAVGGDVGWVQQGQLAEELEVALANAQPGQLVGPIRSTTGYHIIALRDRRTPSPATADEGTVTIEHLYLRLPAASDAAERAEVEEQADRIKDRAVDCPAMERLRTEATEASFPLPNKVKVADLSDQLRATVSTLKVGEMSKPVDVGEGLLLIMLCERQAAAGAVDRERVEGALANQRIDMLARRYMRDLRRAAFLDVRV